MSNNVTVKWMQVSGFTLRQNVSSGEPTFTASYNDLNNASNNRSTLNFGNVQAGRITGIKCVVARFSGASHISDFQFWLDSTDANATGSTNTDLSGGGWEFYYCIVPKSELNFNIESDAFTDEQKKGQKANGQFAYLDRNNKFNMSRVPRSADDVDVNQFKMSTSNNSPLVLDIPDGSGNYKESHLIMLDVQTPSDANSGNTEGWYYRMNFLYS